MPKKKRESGENLSRRKFLKGLGAVSAAGVAAPLAQAGATPAAGKGKLPHRVLGKTGVSVSIMAFGGGSRFLMYEEEEKALEALNFAFDSGITYMDTAHDYQNLEKGLISEERVGKLMSSRRKDIFLATKIGNRDPETFWRDIEVSLKRLQVDHVDLLHIHGLGKEEDLAKIEAKGGPLELLYRAKEQKLTRFIGMTSHTDGATMAKAIERHDLDCVQMFLNPTMGLGFEELALPAAKKKNLGVIAMKVTAQEQLVGTGPGRTGISTLLRYDLSLPVSVAVIGMPKIEYLRQNLEIVRNFKPLTEAEVQSARDQLAPVRAQLEKTFCHHCDGHNELTA